jgi:hypothetical protein
MSSLALESGHMGAVLLPVADALSGTVNTAWLRVSEYSSVVWNVAIGVSTGGTATATLKVQVAKDNSGTGVVDAGFFHRVATSANTADNLSSVARINAGSTVATAAGSNQFHAVEFNCKELPDGFTHARLVSVETTDDPRVASVTYTAYDCRTQGADTPRLRVA